MELATTKETEMTLFDVYRQASRRGYKMDCELAGDSGLGNGRTEQNLTVAPGLVAGFVAVQQGLTSDWRFVPPQQARGILVTAA